MPAGDLRERVTFQKRESISGDDSPQGDDYGNTLGDFEDQFTVAADVTPRLGGEQILQSRRAGVNLVDIIVRYSSNTEQITPAWRCYDARTNRLYNILSDINPDKRRRYIELLCERTDEYVI